MPFLSSIYSSIRPSDISPCRQVLADDNKPYFFSIPRNTETSKIIKSIFQLPYSLFIENSKYDSPKRVLKKILLNNTPDILLSITTSSCYIGDLAHLLTDTINNRFNLNNYKKQEIETCLHEAIMNSMLHGNLKMSSDFSTINGLYAYQTEIEKRLSIGMYKSRRVNIMAWNKNNCLQIAISDEGNGFTIPNYTADDTLPNGRGLMFIHSLADSVWLGEDKRTLFMTFNHFPNALTIK